MWGSIANLKENLNKIALDVHEDDDEELQIYSAAPGDDSSVSHRRNSHRFAQSKSVSRSPLPNGIDSPQHSEIARHKEEIERLKNSEAQIKALSVNYAALLKEKEEQIYRLDQENGSLKQNLNATNTALNAARSEISRTSTNGANVLKVNGELSSSRQQKSIAQAKSRYVGSQINNGIISKQEVAGNGSLNLSHHHEAKQKELADLLEEKNRSLASIQANYESQIKQFRMELEKEQDNSANLELKLQEEHRLNKSFSEELNTMKLEKDKIFTEMSKLRKELNDKISELRRLQLESNKKDDREAQDIASDLRGTLTNLQKENTVLKIEKTELEAALERIKSSTGKISSESKKDSVESFSGKEELELLLNSLKKELKEACHERDKALQELSRLKQHLLEKESEESEKMDEDSKIIKELQQTIEYQRTQMVHLEKAWKQAVANQEEIKMMNNNELNKSKEIISDLDKRLTSASRTIDEKNVELLNLQTALGQYYAEIEAKEHLERDLALAREESAKLSGLLKNAEEQAEASKREKEEILGKLSLAERMASEGKSRLSKIEEDNAKLRRALEQSMTRLNRMSVDSDYLVDRRIVIKLLVTYFQRNYSKEVLDLMVRMLGFSDEDKQRIGHAQQGAGKGVVRGVLGLPGRLVGGILGGSSAVQANMASDNQSFADLWVDFLLKEGEERERREAENAGNIKEAAGGASPNATDRASTSAPNVPNFSRSNFSLGQIPGTLPSYGNLRPYEPPDSEFATVPLTSPVTTSHVSRPLPKY